MGTADVNKSERAALITHRLHQGYVVTARIAAEWCAVSERTARRDLVHIERMLPVVRDCDGRITLMEQDDGA